MAKPDPKKHWEPDAAAFRRLLTWLDEGRDSSGEQYLDIRDRLVHYFARRNCPAPDDLADETLNRVARRLEEVGSIDDILPARYCYIVARFVLLESVRRRRPEAGHSPEDEHEAAANLATSPDDAPEERERTLACLERCLEQCTPAERELIMEYYGAESGSVSAHRKRMAARLGLTANSLAIRAYRIRSRLEKCVRACRDR
jgi:RNA polymerase sigma factor (sigma-70 family)